jgi:hypothetical protein
MILRELPEKEIRCGAGDATTVQTDELLKRDPELDSECGKLRTCGKNMRPQKRVLTCINEPDIAHFVSSCLQNEFAQQQSNKTI